MEPATPVPGVSPAPCETSVTVTAAGPPLPIDLHVCVLCRLSAEEDVRSGRRLHDALIAAQPPGASASDGSARVRIVPAECLSNCSRACSIAFAGRDRWTYVYGNLAPDSVDAILAVAARYAASTDGIVPWRERPEALRKGLVARIPPLTVPPAPAPTPTSLAPQDA